MHSLGISQWAMVEAGRWAHGTAAARRGRQAPARMLKRVAIPGAARGQELPARREKSPASRAEGAPGPAAPLRAGRREKGCCVRVAAFCGDPLRGTQGKGLLRKGCGVFVLGA